MIKVHYFFDPMCGWCYGATPLIEALLNTQQFELIYHPGGMIGKREIDPSFRQHILTHDAKIASETGAHFGEDYKAIVNSSDPFILDSFLPTRSIIAAEEMGIEPMTMLKAIQQAHYQQGEPVYTAEILEQIAASLQIDVQKWQEKMSRAEKSTQIRIQESHALMGELQVGGYPTLIAEINDQLIRLPHSLYYKKVSEWEKYLSTLL